jgi:hypothetical protein
VAVVKAFTAVSGLGLAIKPMLIAFGSVQPYEQQVEEDQCDDEELGHVPT